MSISKAGVYMPAEWQRHERCWMIWPYRSDNWKNNAENARTAYAAVAKAISRFEPVFMGARSVDMDSAQSYFPSGCNVTVVNIESNDSWMRDTGPTFVYEQTTGEVGGINWIFNGWGQLNSGIDVDIANRVMDLAGISLRIDADFVLEGGSIHVDGEGTVLTTEECLLNPNRNPSLSKVEIEQRLLHHLGAEKVIWLKRGLYGDHDTNGHIDNIACFCAPGEVLLTWCDDPADPQYEISRECMDILTSATDARGRSLTVHKLLLPPPMYYSQEDVSTLAPASGVGNEYGRQAGERMAGSYVNFYIANGGIVCPSFHPETDELALGVLQRAFPDREVVMVPGRDILLGGGNIHCITQQQPAAKSV